jgi:hypothetical protein
MRLCMWKSPRPRRFYEANPEPLVVEATRMAYAASEPRLKLHALLALRGVSVAVAATILHYFHPDEYPIFDVRARTTLKKAGLWSRATGDNSVDAWEEYVETMRRLKGALAVSLRDLDKALYAFDRGWDPR